MIITIHLEAGQPLHETSALLHRIEGLPLPDQEVLSLLQEVQVDILQTAPWDHLQEVHHQLITPDQQIHHTIPEAQVLLTIEARRLHTIDLLHLLITEV